VGERTDADRGAVAALELIPDSPYEAWLPVVTYELDGDLGRVAVLDAAVACERGLAGVCV